PGFHGVHIHEYAKCEGPDFKSSGNHLNPDGSQHGLMNPDGPHLGDLPNVEADSSGYVETEIMEIGRASCRERGELWEGAEDGIRDRNVTGVQTCALPISPGFHGVHIHEYAKCEGPDFKSSGNHLNPDGSQHGLMNPDGPHLGDLPNVEADSSGYVETEIM